MSWQATVLVIAALFAAVIIWLGRYDLVAVPAGGEGVQGVVYRLDRWTGRVVYMQGATGGRVAIEE